MLRILRNLVPISRGSIELNEEKKEQKWTMDRYRIESDLDKGLFIGNINGKFQVLTFDQNQILSTFTLSLEDNSLFEQVP